MGLLDTEILVGTYEEFVLGYKIEKKLKTKDEYELVPGFTQRAHIGPVRCITGVNKFIVSGGSDDMCKIYDLVNRVEHGQLVHHDSTVSCVRGFGKSYLLTGSDDNSLAVVKVGSWQVEKTLYKHTAGITALAVHPSGKLAFTAAKDKKLISWNLVKARPAFITNIKGIADLLEVSPDGNRYCVGLHRRIDIYSMETAGIEYTIELKSRPNGLVFLGNQIVAVAAESSRVQIHSLVEKSLIKEFEAHETRVRCITSIPDDASEDENTGHVLVTASTSDSKVKMWRVLTDPESEVTCIAQVDTSCRVTCLTTWNPLMKGAIKKKRKAVTTTEQTDSKDEVKSSPAKKKVKIMEKGDDKDAEADVEEVVVVEQEINERSTEEKSGNKKKKKKKKPGKPAEAGDDVTPVAC